METNQNYFQAIGIIKGNVTLATEPREPSSISIQGKNYPLFCVPKKSGFKAFEAFQKEIESTGNTDQRLIVYPKIIHFPAREKPHIVGFQLVGFVRDGVTEGVTADLADFEFKLSGLWQFIPVCQTPCISVFKNFNDQRLEFVKKAELYQRVRFMKGSHIPVFWKDAPVRPFRFNPKLEKEEQGKPYFASIKAKFLPGRNVFGFESLLALPQDEAPKFFKASKKMKAEAMQATKEFKKAQKQTDKSQKLIETEQQYQSVAVAEKPKKQLPKPKSKKL